MRIEINKLKMVVLKIIDTIKNEYGGDNIEIEEDDYFYIPADIWSDFDKVYKSNITFPVGSLEDDWKSLLNLLEEDGYCTCIDFDRVASILRAISEKVCPGDSSIWFHDKK